MLSDKSSSAIVAVSDLDRARKFYGETLGLKPDDASGDGIMIYKTGKTSLVVYPSDEAGTNRANAVVWGVGDELEAIVSALADRGVRFEEYDMPDTTYSDGVHRTGDFRMAWFKDPDGNILHFNSAN